MNESPRQDRATPADHVVVAASRRAVAARARFERELAALVGDLHAVREAIHGHALPYTPPATDQAPAPDQDQR